MDDLSGENLPKTPPEGDVNPPPADPAGATNPESKKNSSSKSVDYSHAIQAERRRARERLIHKAEDLGFDLGDTDGVDYDELMDRYADARAAVSKPAQSSDLAEELERLKKERDTANRIAAEEKARTAQVLADAELSQAFAGLDLQNAKAARAFFDSEFIVETDRRSNTVKVYAKLPNGKKGDEVMNDEFTKPETVAGAVQKFFARPDTAIFLSPKGPRQSLDIGSRQAGAASVDYRSRVDAAKSAEEKTRIIQEALKKELEG